MEKDHLKITHQYKKNEKSIEKSLKKAIALEVILVGIVIYMKAIQETVGMRANVSATSVVLVVLCLHFLEFYPRRNLYKKSAEIVLKGVEFEKNHPSLKFFFFKDYLKNFNILGSITEMALFDILSLYFFSVSYTQLLRAINPDIIEKLSFITPISTTAIFFTLGRAYYKVIRPLVQTKRSLRSL